MMASKKKKKKKQGPFIFTTENSSLLQIMRSVYHGGILYTAPEASNILSFY